MPTKPKFFARAEQFREIEGAWEFFQTYPPYLKKQVSYWVMSAKKEETRLRRLHRLIESCAKGQRIGLLPAKSVERRRAKR